MIDVAPQFSAFPIKHSNYLICINSLVVLRNSCQRGSSTRGSRLCVGAPHLFAVLCDCCSQGVLAAALRCPNNCQHFVTREEVPLHQELHLHHLWSAVGDGPCFVKHNHLHLQESRNISVNELSMEVQIPWKSTHSNQTPKHER